MKTPFTVEQFFEVFKNYNKIVFPAQLFFYLIGFIAFYLIIRYNSKSSKIIITILSFLWIWMGVVYHLMFFTSINPGAYLFGIIFIVQGILFLIYGVFQNKLIFRFNTNGYGIWGITLIFYAMIAYPVLGYFNGHIYPSSPTFGLPCPTTIFTFGLLLFAERRIPVPVLIIPLIWSIIGFTAAFRFGITEDTGLLIAGFVSFTLFLIRNRKLSIENLRLKNLNRV